MIRYRRIVSLTVMFNINFKLTVKKTISMSNHFIFLRRGKYQNVDYLNNLKMLTSIK